MSDEVKVLHQWELAGRRGRLVETEPGIAAWNVWDRLAGEWQYTNSAPLGVANEIANLAAALATRTRELEEARRGWGDIAATQDGGLMLCFGLGRENDFYGEIELPPGTKIGWLVRHRPSGASAGGEDTADFAGIIGQMNELASRVALAREAEPQDEFVPQRSSVEQP